jgi:streptomycin 6-kinase
VIAEIASEHLAGARGGLDSQRSALEGLGATLDVERGLTELAALIASESSSGLVHGDLNPHNILLGSRWMVIDPKPMAGGPEYDVWPLVSQLGDRAHLEERLTASGFSTDRTVRWGIARSALDLLWAIDAGIRPDHAALLLRAWCRLSGP